MGLLHELKQRIPCPELQFLHMYEDRTGHWTLQAPTSSKVLAVRSLGGSDILDWVGKVRLSSLRCGDRDSPTHLPVNK